MTLIVDLTSTSRGALRIADYEVGGQNQQLEYSEILRLWAGLVRVFELSKKEDLRLIL